MTIVENEQKALHKTEGGKALTKLREKDYEQMVIKFRNAHAVAKHDKSFRDFKWICELDEVKGLDVGAKYITDKSCKEFLHYIADSQRSQSFDIIRKSTFLSFAMDGTSDFMGEELESMYIRTSSRGIVSDNFLKLAAPKSTSSPHLHELVISTMDKLGIQQDFDSKLVGMCADGASNMQGRKHGLAALLLRAHPEMTIIHCLGHRVELAFKDSIKLNKPLNNLHEKAVTLLLGLYYMYRQSAKQKHALKESFVATNVSQVLPTRVGGTRWLSHILLAINRFLKGYKAFVAHLSTASQPPVNNSKAEGLAKLATDVRVVCFILTLKVILSKLHWILDDIKDITYRWYTARLQYLQCVNNGITAVLH